jgi:hypothetical protein
MPLSRARLHTLTAETHKAGTQLNNERRGEMEPIYRALLRIVARLESASYTAAIDRQTVERQPDDPADPASASDTSQG